MKRFNRKRKNFTIPEGHYTGPQQETIDGWLEAANTAGIVGAGLGAARSYISEKEEDKNKSTIQKLVSGASQGYFYGALSGMAIKGITEYINKPLKDIEFQKLDRSIRSEFGSFKIPIINKAIGLEDKSNSIKDKIVYNDRNLTNFKLNFGIRKDQIVMYTFGVSDSELDSLSMALDDFVQTQPNMNYHSSLINKSQNSYAVAITFTTYSVAAKYIIRAAEIVSSKVNVLDRDYIIARRVNEFNVDKLSDSDTSEPNSTSVNNNVISEENDDSVKVFSLTGEDKYSALEFLKNEGGETLADIARSIKTRKISSTASNHLIRLVQHAIGRAAEKGKIKAGLPVKREELNSGFLIDTLNKLRYVKGFNYTVDKTNNDCNISMVSGIFVVSIDKGDKSEQVDEEFYNKAKDRIRRSEIDKVVSYVYSISSRSDFEFLLKKLFSTKLKFNVIP